VLSQYQKQLPLQQVLPSAAYFSNSWAWLLGYPAILLIFSAINVEKL